MQALRPDNGGIPSMTDASSGLMKSVKRYAGFFLALMLLAALWSTALGRISERKTSITLLSAAGTDILNPLLQANGSGLGQGLYGQIEQQANASPTKPLNLPFLKIAIPGSVIAHKDFAQGSQAIYAQVAAAYYDGGPSATFNLPSELQQGVNTYTPFTQPSNGTKSPLPNLPIPHLPAFATQFYTYIGLTPTSFTAEGHNAAVSRSGWLWLLSALLAGLLALLSAGWLRLWNVAWSVFHAAWHIALVGIIGTVALAAYPHQTAPYRDVINLIEGTFMPVFYGAALVGLIGIIVSFVGQRLRPSQSAAQPASRQSPALQSAAALGYAFPAPAEAPHAVPPMAAPPVDEALAPASDTPLGEG